MKKILKAVIPAAGMGTRFLPITKAVAKEMLPIIDKPAIHYVIQEAIDAGIIDILIITSDRKPEIRKYFNENLFLKEVLKNKSETNLLEEIEKTYKSIKISFLNQLEPKGLGDAIRLAKDFINNEPFAVLLPDDIIENKGLINATKECINAFYECESLIIGVQKVDKKDISKYGIIQSSNYNNNLIDIEKIVEKPSIEEAPSNIASIGRYIFLPSIFSTINHTKPTKKNIDIDITSSINIIIGKNKIYGTFISGKRFDTGHKLGYFNCIMHYAKKEKLI